MSSNESVASLGSLYGSDYDYNEDIKDGPPDDEETVIASLPPKKDDMFYCKITCK